MGRKPANDERTQWIHQHIETDYKPLLGDWKNWKPGDPVPTDTVPENWIMDVAWPAFKAKFELEKAPDLGNLKKKFACYYRNHKEQERAHAGKTIVAALVAGTVSLSSQSSTSIITTSAPAFPSTTSKHKLHGAIPWAATLTGREMFLVQERERINEGVLQQREEGRLSNQHHAALLQTARKQAWDSLPESEKAEWNDKAKALAERPPDVFNNQVTMLHHLPQLVVDLPGMDKHQVGRSAFVVLGSYRDAKDNLCTFSVQESYPKAATFDLADIETAWKAHCNKILPVHSTLDFDPDEDDTAAVVFPALTAETNLNTTMWNLELYLKAHWDRQRSTPFEMGTFLKNPVEYLHDDVDAAYQVLLRDVAEKKVLSVYALADKLHNDRIREFFKPSPPPSPTPMPPATQTKEPKTPKKKKSKRNQRTDTEAIAHGRPGDLIAPSSPHDWEESPNAAPATDKVKKHQPKPGLNIPVAAFLTVQQTVTTEIEDNTTPPAQTSNGAALSSTQTAQEEQSKTAEGKGKEKAGPCTEDSTPEPALPAKLKRAGKAVKPKPTKPKAVAKGTGDSDHQDTSATTLNTVIEAKNNKRKRGSENDGGKDKASKKLKSHYEYAWVPAEGILEKEVEVDVTEPRMSRAKARAAGK
ncbi:hypothetical protein V5O48_012512 [Marasmius crinis-equi]|uniref:Uncharacterized protein n=1 Tax=Marasmius crinis-equi TaxID=585013 RepID=A0ABR3F2K2_9AGAR